MRTGCTGCCTQCGAARGAGTGSVWRDVPKVTDTQLGTGCAGCVAHCGAAFGVGTEGAGGGTLCTRLWGGKVFVVAAPCCLPLECDVQSRRGTYVYTWRHGSDLLCRCQRVQYARGRQRGWGRGESPLQTPLRAGLTMPGPRNGWLSSKRLSSSSPGRGSGAGVGIGGKPRHALRVGQGSSLHRFRLLLSSCDCVALFGRLRPPNSTG